jgi:hypothetical protein
MKITGNEPAMPVSETEKDRLDKNPNISYPGLTIRQQFAMAAMQGLISQAQSSEAAQDKYTCNGGWVEPITICKNAVIFADALIDELNRTDQ